MAIPVYLWLQDDGGADIKGSVDVQKREGSIEVVAQDHSLYIPTDNNTGKLTGTRVHTPFLFTKEIDASSPYLYKAVTTGQTLKSAEFKWYGEVVAYRIDSRYPTTTHRLVPLATHEAPYATGFVLVRHRLQAPSVDGVTEAPPSLTFYSLYMHLQDWATYQADPQQQRPAFWRQRYRVRTDAHDPIRKGLNVRSSPNAKSSVVTVLEPGTEVRITNSGSFRQLKAILSGPQQGTLPMGNHGGPGYVWFKSLDSTAVHDVYKVQSTVADPMDLGLNIRKAANKKSEVLAVLPRGAEIEITGTQGYCKLQAIHGGTPEPALAAGEEGQLPGYVWFGDLEAGPAPGRYRVKSTVDDPMRTGANVLAEAKAGSTILSVLSKASEVKISGTGKYRKLLALVTGSAEPPLSAAEDGQLPGYVLENLLEKFGSTEPEAQDQVVFLEQPVSIKAGELIGHLGQYQDYGEALPQKKLHLEVFTGDNVRDFIQQSRAWAARLPASGKTWLKLAKGTRVITHQEGFNKQNPPSLTAPGTESAADLLVPKSLLDGLRPECRINLAATTTEKACNWYRLDGLLHDVNRTLLDGWVREEVGVTPRHSPWEWEGYDFIVNTETIERNCAALMCALGEIEEGDSDTQLKADLADKGPVRTRLFDLIDQDRDGQLTAQEVQAAIALPSLAQSLAQLIIHYESEWYWRPGKWDALDKLFGDTSSTPNENWRGEKQRIQQLCWWSEVADKLGLPIRGAVWHMSPIGVCGTLKRPYFINYEVMYSKKGWAYTEEQIKSYSHYRLPIDSSSGRVFGNSRIHGDISLQFQREVIDIFAEIAREYALSKMDLAMLLAIANVESGFNPDAAAGTTSAAGLGQFVDATAEVYGVNTNLLRFDAKAGAEALVRHYLDNRILSRKKYSGREMYLMIYAYHHDGPSLAYGGRGISENQVMPKFDLYLDNISDGVMD